MALLISNWQVSYTMGPHDILCLCECSSLFHCPEISRHDLLERCTQGNFRSYDSDGIPFCEYPLTLPLLIDDND